MLIDYNFIFSTGYAYIDGLCAGRFKMVKKLKRMHQLNNGYAG